MGRVLRVAASVAAKAFLSYLPLVGLLWLVEGRPRRFPGAGFLLTLHGAAVVAYAVLHARFDSVQYWATVYTALGTPTLTLLTVRIWTRLHGSGWHKTAIPLVVGILLASSVSGARKTILDVRELQSVRDAIPQLSPEGRVLFLQDHADFQTAFDRNVLVYTPLPELLLLDDRYAPVALSVADVPEDEWPPYRAYERALKARAWISRFSAQRPHLDSAASRHAFIKELNAEWILLSPSSVFPADLQGLLIPIPTLVVRGWRWHRLE